MAASINDYCIDSRWRDWLHCLTRLTKYHQHSHVSSARAHVLWCAEKHELQIHHNITYLAGGGSRFHVMTLTFDLMTFIVLVHRLPRGQIMDQIVEKIRGRIYRSIHCSGFARIHLGAYSPLLDLLAEFKLRRSLLGASTCAFGIHRQSPKTLDHNCSSRHPRTYR